MPHCERHCCWYSEVHCCLDVTVLTWNNRLARLVKRVVSEDRQFLSWRPQVEEEDVSESWEGASLGNPNPGSVILFSVAYVVAVDILPLEAGVVVAA